MFLLLYFTADNVPTFKVGDKVNVKSSVKNPIFGWGNVTRDSIGIVMSVDAELVSVDFSNDKGWMCVPGDLQSA